MFSATLFKSIRGEERLGQRGGCCTPELCVLPLTMSLLLENRLYMLLIIYLLINIFHRYNYLEKARNSFSILHNNSVFFGFYETRTFTGPQSITWNLTS